MALVPVPLHDPTDPRLAPYLGLRDPAQRRDLEAATGLFVAEGWKAVSRLLTSGLVARSVVVAAPRQDRIPDELPEPATDVPLHVVERGVLDGVAGFAVHRGVLALAERPAPRPWQDVAAGARRLLVVEGVNDQANLGSLFRSAAGLGAGAVLLCPRACDPFYRRTVRVSLGASFLVPSARVEPWPAALHELAAAGWAVVALDPAAPDALVDVGPLLRSAPRVAVLVGSEGDGLTPAALAAATHRLGIPMAPDTDSLNVTVAAAIALWALRPV